MYTLDLVRKNKNFISIRAERLFFLGKEVTKLTIEQGASNNFAQNKIPRIEYRWDKIVQHFGVNDRTCLTPEQETQGILYFGPDAGSVIWDERESAKK